MHNTKQAFLSSSFTAGAGVDYCNSDSEMLETVLETEMINNGHCCYNTVTLLHCFPFLFILIQILTGYYWYN